MNSLWRKWICFHPSEMKVYSETVGEESFLESCTVRWYETVVKILD